LTSLFYLVFFGATLFGRCGDASASAVLGTSRLETDGAEEFSVALVSAIFDVSLDGVSGELWGCEADEVLDDTVDLDEEKK
jgi:hypothetical protein